MHSDGGIVVTGNNDAGVNAEHVSGVTIPGNRSQFTNVRVAAPDRNPYAFDLGPWKPGAPLAVAAGNTYRAVEPSACTTGTWKRNAADLTAGAIFYRPCNVQVDAANNSTITSTFLTISDITLAANKGTIRPVAMTAAGVSFAAVNVVVEGQQACLTRTIRAVVCLTALGCVTLASCSEHRAAQCRDGGQGTALATVGGGRSSGFPDRSPIADATNHTVVLLVKYTQRESGFFPVTGTQVAVIRAGEDPVLREGELGNANLRIESVRRTAHSIRLTQGRYFLATGESDGPVEIRQCA